jgi:hypothetical protein
MSSDRMRTFEEAPWISLLPADQRVALERLEADPEEEEWAALVAADRVLEDDLRRPSRSARWLVPLAAGGLLAAILLALDPAGVADRGRAAGGSSATGSGEVAAVTEVPERNRAVLASSVFSPAAGAAPTSAGKPTVGGGKPSKPRKPPAGGGGGGAQTPPPGSTAPPGGQVSVPGIEVPSVQVPAITVPPIQVPGVQLPPVQMPPISLPPVQLPPLQLPQLPPLLPPPGQ